MAPLFDGVFRDEDMAIYAAHVPSEDPKKAKLRTTMLEGCHKKWRTWQMSDHASFWIKLRTDFADDYLSGIAMPMG